MPKGYSISHIGNKRKNNQDSLLSDDGLSLYAVADGMGGHNGGEVASALAIETLQDTVKKAIKQPHFYPERSLPEAFQTANIKVFTKAGENEKELTGMGTTLVACMIWDRKAFFGNVGDSRAYLFRENNLWRITEDHSIINSQIKGGLIDREQAPFLMGSNVITRSIGFFPEIQVDMFQRDLKPEDLFLLCSDGLNEISDKEICELAQTYAPSALPKQCLNKVLSAEGHDNISIVAVDPFA